MCDACDRPKDATVTVTRTTTRHPVPAHSPRSGWVHSRPLDDQLRQQATDAATHISKICAEARAGGTLFVDDEFSASDRSLFGEGEGMRHGYLGRHAALSTYDWKRPSQLGTGWVVTGESINSSDILQGELGDCWFLSALSVLADRPHLIDRILLTKKYNPEGAYAVRFFHDGDWKRVVVDDFFPTKYRQLAFGCGKGQQLWVSILEKAYAKLHGSYAAIVTGRAFDALFDLTGAPCEHINFEKEGVDLNMAWGRLLSFRESSFLMAASCWRSDANEAQVAQFEAVGLVLNHAYSLVDVRAEAGVKLVKLRNPWGRQEWSGDWGRDSNRWTAEWKQRLQYPEDKGTFWMTWPDFLLHFSSVDVCKEQTSWYSVSLSSKIPNYPAATPLQMFELTAASATWMFVMLIQPGLPQRGVRQQTEYPDLAALVLEAGGEKQTGISKHPLAHIWPTMDRVCHVDFLTRPGKLDYVLLPFSTAVRDSPIPLTLAVYSARPIVIRPVPYDGELLSRHLPISVVAQGEQEELHDGIFVSHHKEGHAVFVAAVNRDPYHYALIGVDSTEAVNLTSSRKKLVTRDVLPPQTRQLVAILTQKMGSSSCDWTATFSSKKMHPAYWRAAGSPTQTPKLTGDGALHRPHPLGGPPAAPAARGPPMPTPLSR
jgi:calpain-15